MDEGGEWWREVAALPYARGASALQREAELSVMVKLRRLVGVVLEFWGGIRLVVDLLSSLDATRDYMHSAFLQFASAPSSLTLTVTVLAVGSVLLLYDPAKKLLQPPQPEQPFPAAPATGIANGGTVTGWFSIEGPGEVHSHTPLSLSIRNCGPRFARGIRFDPIESRHGLRLWLIGMASLAPGERVPLGFRVGENGEYVGVVGHVVSFFEGGSYAVNQPPYAITIRFLDGSTERVEQHTMEGHPLPRGGVTLKIYPTVDSTACAVTPGLPARRPLVVPKRYGAGVLKHHLGYKGLAVMNDGTPAYDVSVSNVALGSRATLVFQGGHTERLTQADDEAFYPAFIQARLGGTFGAALASFMVEEGIETVTVPLTYRDQESRWYQTDVALSRDVEKSGGLRLDWKQRAIPAPTSLDP